MVLQAVYPVPGICKSSSDYAAGKPFGFTQGRMASGRYIDGKNTRFVAGFPEKLAGWQSVANVSLTGTPRAMKSYRDLNGDPLLGIGTTNHLYTFDGTTATDITPLRTMASGNLTNPITTTNASTTVAVADASQVLSNGDWVYLKMATAVGGITLNGWYQVSGRTGSGYNVTAPTEANAGAGPGGGTTAYQYPRKTLSSPFTTESGSPTVTVTDNGHGLETDDYADFSGASAVGGLTLNGEFQVTVVDANSYTITAGSNANATTTGGGTVTVAYLVGFTNRRTWTLASYGSWLMSCPFGGTIYIYDPAAGGRSYPLLNAPTNLTAMFVTPERFVTAWGRPAGVTGVSWSDQNDPTQWTTSPTNTANTLRQLQGGTVAQACIAVRNGLSLLFTDRAVFEMSYTGDTFVYQTLQVGDNCGTVGQHSVVVTGGSAYWIGYHDFWMWNGSVQPIPSDDIRDYVFSNIDRTQIVFAFAGSNSAKKEVWFFYTALDGLIHHVIYHLDQACWSIGQITRNCWEDSTLFSYPFASNNLGKIYQHELGVDDDGSPMDCYLTFAPTDISSGSRNMDMTGFIPDFARLSGSISLTVNTRYYPQDADTANGPYTITDSDTTPRLDLRCDGKMIGWKVESNVLGGDFRLGLCRVDVQPAGARN